MSHTLSQAGSTITSNQSDDFKKSKYRFSLSGSTSKHQFDEHTKEDSPLSNKSGKHKDEHLNGQIDLREKFGKKIFFFLFILYYFFFCLFLSCYLIFYFLIFVLVFFFLFFSSDFKLEIIDK
jgi:hypothetical protein